MFKLHWATALKAARVEAEVEATQVATLEATVEAYLGEAEPVLFLIELWNRSTSRSKPTGAVSYRYSGYADAVTGFNEATVEMVGDVEKYCLWKVLLGFKISIFFWRQSWLYLGSKRKTNSQSHNFFITKHTKNSFEKCRSSWGSRQDQETLILSSRWRIGI